MFFYMSKGIKSMTPSSLSPHYTAQSPSGRKPDLVAKEVLEWWQTNGKHPFIQPHISSPSNVGANSPENLPLGDKVQLIRLPVASPSAVKEFSQVSSEEPAHLTTVGLWNCFMAETQKEPDDRWKINSRIFQSNVNKESSYTFSLVKDNGNLVASKID
ncbi:hypothetical protein J3Q64DRAFT_1817022 [Phycomyces blakesleeanus]|uniref:Uncharacterized protein n=2 Tax=Phycomyces blakesleeanus TaxID=4837 RepID=A0A162URG2_PHYB8|nr:hypothetical protein PHYBLDRAFT_164239 [Phycomyces blakesleeanus NRRL 1555(-)]OAD77323.1 hypothetical protein PHYBLDRAFT_164239 [Phycomyces blakesleeanus NRRL 1555(-)]|eukprot:XP_018295363.1 hypothetical protein PHYBLDRAFT_164239 [Phycomyces blakesleeanus NRRL 1555(-)]